MGRFDNAVIDKGVKDARLIFPDERHIGECSGRLPDLVLVLFRHGKCSGKSTERHEHCLRTEVEDGGPFLNSVFGGGINCL